MARVERGQPDRPWHRRPSTPPVREQIQQNNTLATHEQHIGVPGNTSFFDDSLLSGVSEDSGGGFCRNGCGNGHVFVVYRYAMDVVMDVSSSS
jgi:hypothetical protein